MADPFASADSATSPARRWAAVSPNDSSDLADLPKALYVGGAGTLALTGGDGTEASFAVGAGAILPLRPKRVKATGTTATGIVALY